MSTAEAFFKMSEMARQDPLCVINVRTSGNVLLRSNNFHYSLPWCKQNIPFYCDQIIFNVTYDINSDIYS